MDRSRARSGGPSDVERLPARKPGPRSASDVTMDCQIRNHHVRYREHVFLREHCCCCAVKPIDLVFHGLYGLTGAAEIRVAI